MKNAFMGYVKIVVVFFVAVFLGACDTVTEPYYTQGTVDPGDTNSVKKVVLLEDFTGIGCNNCPSASEVAADIVETYPDQVVVVAIHAGPFADPRQINPGGVDYRTEVGTELYSDFGFSSLPNGLVNRIEIGGSRVLGVSAWFESVASELNEVATVDLAVETMFDSSTRKATVDVGIEALSDLPEHSFVSVWLLESGMVSPQKDNRQPSGKVENYTHKHVLRATFNGTYGDQLAPSALLKGQELEKQFELTLDQEFDAEHCSVVVFVHVFDETSGDRTVLQAAEVHLGE